MSSIHSVVPVTLSARPTAESVSPASRLAVTVEHLAQSSLFKGVPRATVEAALLQAQVKRLGEGGVLIQPGETKASLFIVLEGSLGVHLGTIDNDAVASVSPGDSVGELSVVDDAPRSAFVVAKEAARLVELSRELFWSLTKDSPKILENLLVLLAKRLRGNNSAVSESRRMQEEYKRHALVDGLTGLYNRRWLDEVLPRQVRRSLLQKLPLCVVMIDVDHFKKFNDVHGHQAGDFVLFAVARVLQRRFRPTDLTARYGGEEFTVVLPEAELAGARIAADRVREQLQQTELELPDGRALPNVTVSMGMAELRCGDTMTTLIERADQALYQAKLDGRNCVRPDG